METAQSLGWLDLVAADIPGFIFISATVGVLIELVRGLGRECRRALRVWRQQERRELRNYPVTIPKGESE